MTLHDTRSGSLEKKKDSYNYASRIKFTMYSTVHALAMIMFGPQIQVDKYTGSSGIS